MKMTSKTREVVDNVIKEQVSSLRYQVLISSEPQRNELLGEK